jgi:hypothetical protein
MILFSRYFLSMTKWILVILFLQGCSDLHSSFSDFDSASSDIWAEAYPIHAPRPNPFKIPDLISTIDRVLEHVLFYRST